MTCPDDDTYWKKRREEGKSYILNLFVSASERAPYPRWDWTWADNETTIKWQ